jgi:putative Mg2+ transporter-C (MgtC) family protein
MTIYIQAVLLVKVLFTAFLSMIIGFDRERLEKSAGLRTHMLAGIGACLFTVVGAEAFDFADSARVAAGVVSGIGFLGAGAIFYREGDDHVHELTTAASIWTTAAVGVAVAMGGWLLATGVTVLTWFILVVVRYFERHHLDTKDISNPEKATIQ